MPFSSLPGAIRARGFPRQIVPLFTYLLCGWGLLLSAGCNSAESQDSAAGEVGSSSAAMAGGGSSASTQERLPPPGEAWVIFGTDTVHAEVARSPEERERGLMYRTELAKGRGMIFIFPDAQTRSFWMKDTLIPLDIAYMDATLRIIDIQGMEPQTLDLHPSAQPAAFALEVPLGWFAEVGIEVGGEARMVFGPGR